ncbi:hypothetical protein [Ponticaulis sp.]|nr:hypothetical protein [Ponticaulis sp.]
MTISANDDEVIAIVLTGNVMQLQASPVGFTAFNASRVITT